MNGSFTNVLGWALIFLSGAGSATVVGWLIVQWLAGDKESTNDFINRWLNRTEDRCGRLLYDIVGSVEMLNDVRIQLERVADQWIAAQLRETSVGQSSPAQEGNLTPTPARASLATAVRTASESHIDDLTGLANRSALDGVSVRSTQGVDGRHGPGPVGGVFGGGHAGRRRGIRARGGGSCGWTPDALGPRCRAIGWPVPRLQPRAAGALGLHANSDPRHAMARTLPTA